MGDPIDLHRREGGDTTDPLLRIGADGDQSFDAKDPAHFDEMRIAPFRSDLMTPPDTLSGVMLRPSSSNIHIGQ